MADIRENFIKQFEGCWKNKGFFNFVPFVENQIGFSVQKKLNQQDNKATLIHVGILRPTADIIQPVYITATYGEQTENGVRIRSQYPYNEPYDYTLRNKYFYKTQTNEFFKESKKISACELLNQIYDLHIKATKPIKGFPFRVRLWFWRGLLRWIFLILSKLFHYLLLLLSGDRYSYEPIYQEEKLNGKVQSSNRLPNQHLQQKLEPELQSGDKFDLFGYKASRRSIVIYSILHLAIYLYLFKKRTIPTIVSEIINNNFLVILYVVVSLSILEAGLPSLFKYVIKSFSKLSFYCEIKDIDVVIV